MIPDTRGRLQGLLHTCRNFEFCRDVIVLVSGHTPEAYLRHLEERHYAYHAAGPDHVDLRAALEWLADAHQVRTLLADTGQILGTLLLAGRLASEVSLLVHPVVSGAGRLPMFGEALSGLKLELLGQERFEDGCVWLRYRT